MRSDLVPDLKNHSRSLKQYFFVEHGDTITLFLDLARYELTKRSKNATVSKLQSFLELALRTSSSSAADPFKDDLTVVLHPSTLTDWLVKVTSVDGAFGGRDEGQDALGNGLMDNKNQDNPNIKGLFILSLQAPTVAEAR